LNVFTVDKIIGLYRRIDERSIRICVHRHACAQPLWFRLLIIHRKCWYISEGSSICWNLTCLEIGLILFQ
jgi:hypothetical protein